jgi:hypothetical protein
MISTPTDTIAIIEKRGTERVASGQRSSPASASPRTRNASPPVHVAAACTWAMSAMKERGPLTLACPEADGVTIMPATRTTASPVSGTSPFPPLLRSASATRASVAASAARISEASP